MSNPYGAYLESQVLSASPLQLVQLAYEGTLEAVRQARVHLAERRIFERSRAISKAQEILMELAKALDFEAGGELSTRLAQLYDYMQQRLMEANLKQIEAPLTEVENLLGTLCEGWNQLAGNETATVASSAPAGSSWSMPVEAPVYGRASYSL